jgi:choline dehydrogenase-like flavoprotein
MDVAVIGSGISGFAAAQALVARGLRPTILDVGERLDEPRRAVVEKLRDIPPKLWPKADDELLRHNETIGRDGDLPKKVHFGSDYIYADDRSFAPLRALSAGRAPYPTFAKGGFSNIWGTAVLPVAACDMADWPFAAAELEPHFRKIAQLIPIAGGEGTLDEAFPGYRDDLGALDPGPQGDALIEDLRVAQPRLRQLDVLYGKARLAIHAQSRSAEEQSCTGCGECFVGCVRGSMFSTVPSIERLAREGRVNYRPNAFVESIRDSAHKTTLTIVDAKTLERTSLSFDAVFVAAGPINSARLLLQSIQLYDHDVVLRESQKFVMPLLRRRSAPTAVEHPSVTLASVFLEVKVPSLSDHWVHIQVIPMNRLVIEGSGLPGVTTKLGSRLWGPALRRLMMAWVGMHSDHSSEVVLRLRAGCGKSPDALELDLRPLQAAREAAHVVARDLFRKGFAFGTMFVPWMIKFSNPGSGTHCGGSFPMRREPKLRFDTDVWGRPFGWSRSFVVDASVLPSIPGTTLGFTTMANAHRIASLAPLDSLD